MSDETPTTTTTPAPEQPGLLAPEGETLPFARVDEADEDDDEGDDAAAEDATEPDA